MLNIILLASAMFALGLDAYVLAGLIPGIATSFDVSQGEAAQVVTAFTLCYAIAAPALAAVLAGKPVKGVLALALAIFSIGNLLSAVTNSFGLLIASRCIAGVGAGTFAPVAAAAASSLVPKEKKGRALGAILGGMGTGTVIGVPVGIQIAEAFGWRFTLLLIAIIGIVTIIGVLLKLPTIKVAPPPSLKARLKMLSQPRVASVVTVTLFTAIASLGLYTFMVPLVTGLGRGPDPSLYLWIWGIGGVAGAFTVGQVIDRTGRPGLVLLGILCVLTLALFALPFTGNAPVWVAVIPFFLWGVMGWSSLAPQQHVLLDLQPDHGAVAVALNSSANYLGSSLGAILGGLMLSQHAVAPIELPEAATLAGVIAIIAQVMVIMAKLNVRRVNA